MHKMPKHIGCVAALTCLALLFFLAAENNRAAAAGPVLEIPVACELGRDCFIQFYVDRDTGTGIEDYRCAGLTYDGHKGTDFRLADLPAMRRGVTVRAAAAGTVHAIRDGEPDISADKSDRSVAGREAGNAVVLMHDDGWETQYSHLMKGSISVQKGQRVGAGEALGLIGISGNSTFPHLDFSVRHAGVNVDPFSGGAPAESCARGGVPLWSAAAGKKLDYLPGAVLLAGARAPKLITRESLSLMKRGSAIVDVAVDQGGCVETTHPTTHAEPTYIVDGIVHYAVANMPGAVARTSTFALNNATIPFGIEIANLGWEEAMRRDPVLASGLNVADGRVTNKAVADALGYDFEPWVG